MLTVVAEFFDGGPRVRTDCNGADAGQCEPREEELRTVLEVDDDLVPWPDATRSQTRRDLFDSFGELEVGERPCGPVEGLPDDERLLRALRCAGLEKPRHAAAVR